MNAKTELAKRLSETFSGGTPVTAEALAAILKDYSITKDSDEQRSDLNRRIKDYLGAKRSDGSRSKPEIRRVLSLGTSCRHHADVPVPQP